MSAPPPPKKKGSRPPYLITLRVHVSACEHGSLNQFIVSRVRISPGREDIGISAEECIDGYECVQSYIGMVCIGLD
jgi:hypothetical protein